jgi:superfamily II DNA or RNA helicase
MKILINHPIKAYLQEFTPTQLAEVRAKLTYTNTKITFMINKVKGMRWLKNKDPIAWQARIDELKSELNQTLVFEDGDGTYIRPGSIPYLGLDAPIENTVVYPQPSSMSWAEAPEFEPYLYQDDATAKLIKNKHGNVSLATGLGKSHILLLLSKYFGLRTVVITPSQSIFNELLNEFQLRLGKSVVGGFGDGKKDISKPITIAIGKSLTMLKEGSNEYEFFANKQVMAVDECHTFASETLEKVSHGVLQNVPYRLFCSATITRGDGSEKLLYSIVGKTVLEKTIQEGISEGFLCPLKFKVITSFSPSNKKFKNQDVIECKREHLLYNEEVAKLAAKIANASWTIKQESTLILVEELSQIAALKDLITVPLGYVHSGSKKDAAYYGLDKVNLQEQVDNFNNGIIKVLIGTRAIATGTNMYPTHNTINLMGGGSEIITKQGAMGRSTRKLEISKYAKFHKPKDFCMIYDFYITSQPILINQLKKRAEFYKETGEEIQYF